MFLDVLVEFEKEADLFDFVGLSIFLEEKLGRKVDVVPRDAVRPELKDIILREAVPGGRYKIVNGYINYISKRKQRITMYI